MLAYVHAVKVINFSGVSICLFYYIGEEDEIPEDFSGFIVLDGDDSEAEIDDAEEKLVINKVKLSLQKRYLYDIL